MINITKVGLDGVIKDKLIQVLEIFFLINQKTTKNSNGFLIKNLVLNQKLLKELQEHLLQLLVEKQSDSFSIQHQKHFL